MVRDTQSSSIRILILFAALLIAAACSDDSPDIATPADVYRSFFHALESGNTDEALEDLAPEGALGNTFTAGSYRMLANEFDEMLERHGSVAEIVIEREEAFGDDEVMIEGRLVFDDGTEVVRPIRFTRDNGRWAGHV